jgi:2-phospho-L-lactate guanylyltransferase
VSIWAIVPVRPFAEGKSRLAALLSRDERARLNAVFFRHTLAIAMQAVGRGSTLVVSSSESLLEMAAAQGARTLMEEPPHELNAALTQAARWAMAEGATALLSVSCDLPFLTAADLRDMLDGAAGADLVIASDRLGTGTNAMLVRPPLGLPYRYGSGSFAAHLAAAHAAGLATRIICRPGLAFDIDTPDDLGQMEENRPDAVRFIHGAMG